MFFIYRYIIIAVKIHGNHKRTASMVFCIVKLVKKKIKVTSSAKM